MNVGQKIEIKVKQNRNQERIYLISSRARFFWSVPTLYIFVFFFAMKHTFFSSYYAYNSVLRKKNKEKIRINRLIHRNVNV